MKLWRITGADRTSGKPKEIEVYAKTERGAQDKAYDRWMLVEKIEQIDETEVAIDTDSNAGSKPHHDVDAGIPHRVVQSEPINDGTDWPANFRKQCIPFENARRRRSYIDRGVNTTAEIAIGVFLGLMLFSCIAPMLLYAIGAAINGYRAPAYP